MRCLRNTILLSLLLVLLAAASLTSDCHADCIACWELKGVIVQVKDGTTIEGYATWNDSWPWLGYSSLDRRDQIARSLEKQKEFPEVIFDPAAKIEIITVYNHLRSIKYPMETLLVAIQKPIRVNVKEINDLKLNPGPHDGYNGAGDLPLVSKRIADLLQTKPSASCHFDEGAGDEYWVSYDKSFPEEELKRLCDERFPTDRPNEEIQRLKAKDIFRLYYAYD